MDGTRILHFSLGARRFGLNVSDITEISEIPPPTPVPGAPDVIAGIVDLRGRIVTLMDLATIQGASPASGAPRLAVQLAPPLSHLGILVPGRVEDLETDVASLGPRSESSADGPRSAAAAAAAATRTGGSAPSYAAHDCDEDEPFGHAADGSPDDALGRETGGGEGPAYVLDDGAGSSLGREIVVEGRPTYLLDVGALLRLCSTRLRERFRVAE